MKEEGGIISELTGLVKSALDPSFYENDNRRWDRTDSHDIIMNQVESDIRAFWEESRRKEKEERVKKRNSCDYSWLVSNSSIPPMYSIPPGERSALSEKAYRLPCKMLSVAMKEYARRTKDCENEKELAPVMIKILEKALIDAPGSDDNVEQKAEGESVVRAFKRTLSQGIETYMGPAGQELSLPAVLMKKQLDIVDDPKSVLTDSNRISSIQLLKMEQGECDKEEKQMKSPDIGQSKGGFLAFADDIEEKMAKDGELYDKDKAQSCELLSKT
eukprot:Nk52_evm16s78 gene=Nk52_evmTU16s78